MRDDWIERQLAEVAVHRPGKYLSRENYREGPYTVYGSNSVMGHHADYLYEGPLIVLSRIGSYCGKVMLSQGPAWVNNNASALLSNPELVNPGFLFLTLDNLDMTPFRGGSGQPFIQISNLMAAPLRLPPLREQERIVDLIGAIDNTIAEATNSGTAARESLRQLRDAQFKSAQASASPIRAGDKFDMLLGRQKSARQSVGEHVIPYVRAANITENGWDLSDLQHMNFSPAEQEKYCLAPGDVLLVEGGSVGQSAVWAEDDRVGFDKHVIRLRAKPDVSTTSYAFHWTQWAHDTGAFEQTATGITIKALGFARASAMQLPDLTIEEQVRLTDPLQAGVKMIEVSRRTVQTLTALRQNALSALLSGDHQIPDSYDELMEKAA